MSECRGEMRRDGRLTSSSGRPRITCAANRSRRRTPAGGRRSLRFGRSSLAVSRSRPSQVKLSAAYAANGEETVARLSWGLSQ
jgi:hypothetical protein